LISKIYISFFLCCIILLTPSIHAENVTPDVYPSDEELYEAYLRGDIDYQTYLNLSEIFESGIDSTDLYLLEEIPNISFFLRSRLSDYTELEQEQSQAYLVRGTEKHGWFKSRTYQKLEENGELKNYLQLNSRFGSNWYGRAEYRQNYDGTKRVIRRSITYRPERGNIKEIVVGNYSTRFGLGLTVGYRGKFLSKSESSTEQTIAFPDYGGFNGLYIEGGRRHDSLSLLFHSDRDEETEINLGALENKRKFGDFNWEGIVLGAIVKNRLIDRRWTHYQLGTFLQYYKYSYDVAAELALSRGNDKPIPAAILESSYRQENLSLRFSGWSYGHGFINLAGGGRAGSIYQTVAIDTIDYEFRDKRSGQSGVLLKSRFAMENDVSFNFSFTTYGTGTYNRATELLSGMIYSLNNNSSIGVEYNYKRRDKIGEVSTNNDVRTVYRLKSESLAMRSYLGHRIDKSDKKYISCFTQLKSRVKWLGILELWFNMDKIDYEIGQIDYFYGFIKEIFYLMNYMELAAKYSFRYNRFYSDRESSTFLLEMKLIW
jgi:hypothetical protein